MSRARTEVEALRRRHGGGDGPQTLEMIVCIEGEDGAIARRIHLGSRYDPQSRRWVSCGKGELPPD